MSDLYLLIQDLCKGHNITIAFLERQCDLGNGTIKKWGTAAPSAARLKRVANFFGVSVDYLLINKHGRFFRQGSRQLPFARKITAIRKEQNLSIEELAARTRFTPEELAAVEKGELISDHDEFYEEIAAALQVSVDELDLDAVIGRYIVNTDINYWIEKNNERKPFFSTLFARFKRKPDSESEEAELKDDLMEAFQDLSVDELWELYRYYLSQKFLKAMEQNDEAP